MARCRGRCPLPAILAIVGLGQMLVVQQGGFDLSVPGGVSLAVVIASHYPAGDDALLLPAVGFALVCAVVAGLVNGILIGIVRLNAIIATIGMNALLYGGVFAVSGGVPRITTQLLASIAAGEVFGIGHIGPVRHRPAGRGLVRDEEARWPGGGSRRLAPTRWRPGHRPAGAHGIR